VPAKSGCSGNDKTKKLMIDNTINLIAEEVWLCWYPFYLGKYGRFIKFLFSDIWYSKEMEEIKLQFRLIEDPRHSSYIEHKLPDILAIIMCAVLCGYDELCSICAYAENKAEMLKAKFGIERIPSKPTFCRILNMIDGEKVAQVVIEIMQRHICELDKIIAVDGKAIRSTSKSGHPHSALQILTAYLTESGVTINQKAIHEKTNEIPVFQEMLDDLVVEGKTITADAMHCQRETCQKIVEQGGDYVFGLKANQHNFYEEVNLFVQDSQLLATCEQFRTIEKSRGRIEERICYKLPDLDFLSMKSDWTGLQSVFCVKRKTTQKTVKLHKKQIIIFPVLPNLLKGLWKLFVNTGKLRVCIGF
jgi:predicted transposase YbfD/YdcC